MTKRLSGTQKQQILEMLKLGRKERERFHFTSGHERIAPG